MASSKGIKAGRGFVELFSDDKKLRKGLDSAATRLKAFGATVKRVGAGLAKFGAIASTAAIAGLSKIVTDVVSAGDALGKLQSRIGGTAEFLTRLQFAGEQSDVSLQTLGQSLFKLNLNIEQASRGLGPAAEALTELELSAAKLNKLNLDQRFTAIVGALEKVESPTRRAALATALFGEQSRELLPLLNGGVAGFQAMGIEADNLGRTLSQETLDATQAFADEVNRLKSSLTGLQTELGVAVFPVLTTLSEKLRLLVDLTKTWRETLAGLGLVAGTAVLDVAEFFGSDVAEQRRALEQSVADTVNAAVEERLKAQPRPQAAAPDAALPPAAAAALPNLLNENARAIRRLTNFANLGAGFNNGVTAAADRLQSGSLGTFSADPRQFGFGSVGPLQQAMKPVTDKLDEVNQGLLRFERTVEKGLQLA